MKRKMKTLKSVGKIETGIRTVVINGSEGLEVGLELCFICFFNEKDLTQIWQSMILIKSTCLLCSYFSLIWVVWSMRVERVLHWLWAISKILSSVSVTRTPFRVAAGLNEWSVCLRFSVSCTFFFWTSIILPMITLYFLNREWWLYWEGRGGAGEGRWGDNVPWSQDGLPIVIFSS